MSLIMKINGIAGEATIKGVEKGILLHHMQTSNRRPVIQRPGTTNHEIGMMALDHLTITKSHDAASLKLEQHMYAGSNIPTVEITQYNLTNGYPDWKYKIILSNVSVSSIEDVSDSHAGTEHITLAFSKIEKSYRSQRSSGEYNTPIRTGFDLPTALVC